MQLIILLEADKKAKTDYRYIKPLIDTFYEIGTNKISPIFMESKTRYAQNEKQINDKIRKYQGESKVVLCVDIDQADTNHADKQLNDNIKKYCIKNGYEYVWFKESIESVFLGRTVSKEEKKRQADCFSAKKFKNFDQTKLKKKDDNQPNTSNILAILDDILPKKTNEIGHIL